MVFRSYPTISYPTSVSPILIFFCLIWPFLCFRFIAIRFIYRSILFSWVRIWTHLVSSTSLYIYYDIIFDPIPNLAYLGGPRQKTVLFHFILPDLIWSSYLRIQLSSYVRIRVSIQLASNLPPAYLSSYLPIYLLHQAIDLLSVCPSIYPLIHSFKWLEINTHAQYTHIRMRAYITYITLHVAFAFAFAPPLR
jgi:hypothetical protein